MPINLTFAGKHAQDSELLKYACAFEAASQRRFRPPGTPERDTDRLPHSDSSDKPSKSTAKLELSITSVRRTSKEVLQLSGILEGSTEANVQLEAFVDGQAVAPENISFSNGQWSIDGRVAPFEPKKPLYGGVGLVVGNFNIVLLARCGKAVAGKLVMIPQSMEHKPL
jgi:hypothetical protein